MTVRRFDRTSELLKPRWMPDGSAWFEGRAAAPGVYEYSDGRGNVIRELIDVDVLHRDEDLGTLGGAPVTLNHPPSFVDPDNFATYAQGMTASEIEKEVEGGYVRVRLRIGRADALEAIKTKQAVELSCGYYAELDHTPGVHPRFGAYDRRQISRTYNHLAVVPKGRHGPRVSLRADDMVQRCDGASPWQIDQDSATTSTTNGDDMLTRATLLALLSAGLPAADESERKDHDDKLGKIADAILKAMTPIDDGDDDKALKDAMKEIDKLHKERDALKAELDKLKEKGDAAEVVVPTLAERRRAAADRMALEARATALKLDKVEDTEDAELKRAIVKAVRGDAVPADAPEAVIDAHWHLISAENPEVKTITVVNDSKPSGRKVVNLFDAGRMAVAPQRK